MTGTKGKSGGKRKGAGRKSGRYPLQLLKIACTDKELEEIIKAISDTRLRAEILLAVTHNDEEETWKPIPGFPGYEVSDKGRVKSFKGKRVRILSPSINPKGYPGHTLCVDGNQFHRTVHQLVMLTFVGPRPDGYDICHKDGNPGNGYLVNLRYDTHLANVREIDRQDERAEEIRIEYAAGNILLSELGEKHGLSTGTISNIVRGITNKDAGGPIKADKKGNDRARNIRVEYAAGGISFSGIAKKYNMSNSCVGRIVKGKNRKNAGGPIMGIDY